MAAVDVTRAEFEELKKRVQEVEEEALNIENQFEKFKDQHTEVANKVAMHDDYNAEIIEKIKKFETTNIESTLQDVANAIRKFEAMNIESTFQDMTNAITRMQLQVTNDKAELEQLQRDAAEAGDQGRRANNASVESRMETEKSTCEQEL